MLLKRYRYLLLLKIILLIGGIALLWLQPPSTYTGGTLILMKTPDTLLSDASLTYLQGSRSPWALIEEASGGVFVHVPWTEDSWFILEYLSQQVPPRHTLIPKNTYTDACRTQIIVSDTTYTELPCQLWPVAPVWLPRAIILVGLIL